MTVAVNAAPDPAAAAGALDTARAWLGTEASLLVGVGAIAAAVLGVGIFLSVTAFQGRSAKSLAAIDVAIRGPVAVRDRDLDRSFTERVLEPTRLAVIRLGRHVTPKGQVARISRKLDLAGNPADWDVDRVIAMQVLSVVLAAAVGATIGLVSDAGLLRTLAFVVVGGVIGWAIPTAIVNRMASSRSTALLRSLPDSLDLLTISVESGLSFDSALSYVARYGKGPMAREFSRVLQEMQIGTGRAEALRSLAQRTDVAEVKSFAGAMNQADSFGVPIGRALRVQAEEIRVKRSQRIEERAQQVPVKILFPLIFGILPMLFVAIIGPAAVLAYRSFVG